MPLIVIIILVCLLLFVQMQNRQDNSLMMQTSGFLCRGGSRGGGEYKFSVKAPWFDKIKEGIKSIEGRLKKGRFEHISKGDEIIWYNRDSGEEVKTIVDSVKTYKTIGEMLKAEGICRVLPGINSIAEGETIYNQYYSPENQEKYDVIAIHFKIKASGRRKKRKSRSRSRSRSSGRRYRYYGGGDTTDEDDTTTDDDQE